MDNIRNREVLYAVLLQTLSENNDGLFIYSAYDSINEQYTFPEQWYREIPKGTAYELLKDMGYPDWSDIPQEKLVELVKTEPQWQNQLRWTRLQLREDGYLDISAPRGTWRLTPAGFQAAKNFKIDSLKPDERKIVQSRTQNKRSKENASENNISRRDKLFSVLENLTTSMPLTDLELLADIARTIRARSITEG